MSENNVIKIYYIIDDENTKTLSYTVEYYKDGEKVEQDTETERSTVQVLEPDTLEINKEKINTTNKYVGYKLDKTEPSEIPDTVNNGETIKVYYVKDKFEFTVEYYYDGVQDESKKETAEATYQEEIAEYEDKNITGYKLEKVERTPLTITEIAENNIIKVYYTKRTDLSYKVEYYYDGEIDESKTDIVENQTYETIVEEVTNKVIPGYKLEKTENLPLTVQEYEGLNIIKVYYIKDQFNYTVNYYYDGIKDEKNANTYTATYEDIINTYEDKVRDGYRLEKIVNMPLQITEVAENNVIDVYYVRKDAVVKVKYVDKYNGEQIEEETIKNGKVFDEFDVSGDVKEIEGYTLVESPEVMTGIYAEEPEEKVYYYAQNTKVTVKYLEKDEEAQSLAEEIIIDGYEGKEYTSEKKEIENYTFVKSTENTSGTMTREELEVIYYYLQNTKVTVNYIDKNTEEKLEVITKDGLVGDIFAAVAKDFEDYVLVEKPENETVVMAKEELVLNYYYVHISSGVIEKHIDINTNEVLDSKVYEGNEGDEYKTNSKEFEGYDLVETKLPENAEGTMEVEAIEVKYYYERKTNVRVEYIDKVTGEKLAEDEYIYGHENNEYTAEEKEFEGYVVVKEMYPENSKGTMTKEEIVVKYYYVHISDGVIERHLNAINGELLEEITYHEGNEADEYNIEAKTFEGYDLVEDKLPENAKGQMTKERIVVSYYYVRRAELQVEYIDKYSGERLQEKVKAELDGDIYTEKDSTEIVKGHEGDRYETKEKVFEKYKLVETSNNTSGEMKVTVNEDGTINTRTKVTYYYAKESEGIKEEYIDIITGKPLGEGPKHEGHEGDEYTTKPKDIAGYVVVEEYYPENATGTMKKEETVVKYYYARVAKVEVEYIDQETKAKIIDNVVIDGYEGKEYKTEEKTFKGYKLFDKPYNSTGKMKITEDEDGELENTTKVRYYYIRVPEEVNKPNTEGPTTITNIYNNNISSNGNSNNNLNGNSSGNSGNSNNGNYTSNNNTGLSNYEKTPGTGDILPIVAGVTILGLLVLNIVLWVVHKKCKNKKNFIK